jgi:hypothetical protein
MVLRKSILKPIIAYYEGLFDIITQFINTMDGHPDIKWWDHIMNIEDRRVSGLGPELSGWILKFYLEFCQTKEKVEISNIQLQQAVVPIHVTDKIRKQEYDCLTKAGFLGVQAIDKH